MKPILKSILLVLILAALLAVPRPAAAKSGIYDGQVIFGGGFTLEDGETLDGDLLVFGGSVEIEEGAVVTGTVIIFGGTLSIDGEVEGDVVVAGGTLELGASAHVRGDVSMVGTTFRRAGEARIDGQIHTDTGLRLNGPEITVPLAPQAQPAMPQIRFDFHPLQGLWNSVVFGFLAVLAMLFLAPQAARVSRSVIQQPVTAGGVGLLIAFLSPFAIVLLAATLILAPVAAVLAVALAVMAAFGWIAVGYEIGRRLMRVFRQEWHPSLSAGLGTFILTLAAEILNAPVICFAGLLPTILVGLAAFGAVVLTRFGTRDPAPAAATTPVS
jgi:cytoskeletal protein CcmA (bactofilin family)